MRKLIPGLLSALALVLCLQPVLVVAQAAQPLTKEELDQLVAPVALYPDTLLSQC